MRIQQLAQAVQEVRQQDLLDVVGLRFLAALARPPGALKMMVVVKPWVKIGSRQREIPRVLRATSGDGESFC